MVCASRLKNWAKSVRWLAALLAAALIPLAAQGDQILSSPSNSVPQPPVHDPEGILNLDIEQLARVSIASPTMAAEVTSVSKQESTVAQSPAAIYVITKEMIARSPSNNIPDLLRMAPGVEVARIDAHTWAITIRGDNDRLTDKVLVLVDGRSINSPITGQVNWDTINLMLEDIERIEVTRGPNGTLWGVNAVNGMIQIITKTAKETQGALVTYGGGTEDRALDAARYGGMIGDDAYYRIYGKHCEEAPGYSDTAANDGWRQGRGGFRVDWDPDRDKANQFTVQGDYYTGSEGFGADAPYQYWPYIRTVTENEADNGGNVLARWTHVYSDKADWMLQGYFDQFQRSNSFWTQNVKAFDIQFQDRFPIGDRHELIWGAEYRQTHDNEICDGFIINFDPLARMIQSFDMFAQDQIELVQDRLFFIIGSKFSRNDLTGFDYQPTGRFLYTPDKKHSFWTAVSRAVGTSNRFNTNGMFTSDPIAYGVNVFGRQYGSPDITSEHLWAYELGYREQLTEKFSYDIALYQYEYDNLWQVEAGTPFQDIYGNWIFPYYMVDDEKGGRAWSTGGEISAEWRATEKWRLSGSYSHMVSTYNGGKSPRNQVKCISSWDIADCWQYDLAFRYVDELAGLHVPSYLTMDCRLAYRPNKHLEYALIGRNLLQSHHQEFTAQNYPYHVTEVERSVFANVTWQH